MKSVAVGLLIAEILDRPEDSVRGSIERLQSLKIIGKGRQGRYGGNDYTAREIALLILATISWGYDNVRQTLDRYEIDGTLSDLIDAITAEKTAEVVLILKETTNYRSQLLLSVSAVAALHGALTK